MRGELDTPTVRQVIRVQHPPEGTSDSAMRADSVGTMVANQMPQQRV